MLVQPFIEPVSDVQLQQNKEHADAKGFSEAEGDGEKQNAKAGQPLHADIQPEPVSM